MMITTTAGAHKAVISVSHLAEKTLKWLFSKGRKYACTARDYLSSQIRLVCNMETFHVPVVRTECSCV